MFSWCVTAKTEVKYYFQWKSRESKEKKKKKITGKMQQKNKDKLALFSGCAYSKRYIDDRNYNKTRHIY